MAEPVRKIAVCLLSGGMDSAVTAAEALRQGFDVRALSFRYGQRHAVELAAASRVARALRIAPPVVVGLDLSAIGGSALTADLPVPKDRELAAAGAPSAHGEPRVPSTYVPARNALFLSVALGFAEVLGAEDLFLGVNRVDYSGYPDCRPAFLRAFEELAAVATAAGAERGVRFRVHAPLVELSKKEIVLRARELGVDLGATHSCYDPLTAGERVLACGRCDACALRRKGFAEAGLEDPIPYAVPSPARNLRP